MAFNLLKVACYWAFKTWRGHFLITLTTVSGVRLFEVHLESRVAATIPDAGKPCQDDVDL